MCVLFPDLEGISRILADYGGFTISTLRTMDIQHWPNALESTSLLQQNSSRTHHFCLCLSRFLMALHFVKTAVLSSENGIDFGTEVAVESDETRKAKLDAEAASRKPLFQQLADIRDRKQDEFDENRKKIFGELKISYILRSHLRTSQMSPFDSSVTPTSHNSASQITRWGRCRVSQQPLLLFFDDP